MAGRGVPAVQSPCAVVVRATRVSETIAPLIERDVLRGVVLACHRTALNVMLGGRVVTIAPHEAGGLPDGVNVTPSIAPRDLGIVPGAVVVALPGALRFGTGLEIDLRAAERWSPHLGAIPVGRPGLKVRALAVRAAVSWDGSGFQISRGAASFRSMAMPHIEDLAAALHGNGVGVAAAIGEHLIGLGPGLTPSGDDLLVGVTSTLFALGDPRAACLATAWAAAAVGATTPVAASFHRHAASGDYAQRLHDLLRTVLAGSISRIAPGVQRAAAWGATSGADTLLGVSLALDAAASRVRQPEETAA